MRRDGSTFDLEATQEVALNNGPTRRVVHPDGSVSIMREESTADEAGAVRRAAELRRIEADERELAVEIAMYADLREELVIEADEHSKRQEADIADFDAHVVEAYCEHEWIEPLPEEIEHGPSCGKCSEVDGPTTVSIEVGKVIIEGLATASLDTPVDFRYDGGAYIPIEW